MNYDLIVGGFGTAGAMAAIAAGRFGKKVLVLEKTSYPGGLQTGGMITEYCYQPAAGLAAEMELNSQRLMASGDYAVCVEPKKMTLEENALAVGVDIRYEVAIIEVIVTVDVVRGVVWRENGREWRAEASVVIDATAEAIICRLAGCELTGGRDSDGLYQHSSVIFAFLKNRQSYGYSGVPLQVNQEDVKEFSRSTLSASAAMLEQNRKDLRLSAPTDRSGIREGLHIISQSPVKMADLILPPTQPTEPIGYAYSQFDTNITDPMLESESFQDWMIAATLWGTKIWMPIPRSALFPRGIKGLMVAGRHLGVDHDSGYALRMNAAMSIVGEAAGKIAAAAITQGVVPNEIPYTVIKPLLNLRPSPLIDNERIWGLNDAEILAGLNTVAPGNAIWSAYRQARFDLLYRCLADEDVGSLRHSHAAFALALLRDPAAIPFLHRMIEQRDEIRQISVSFDPGLNAPAMSVSHGCIAIYLSGRFGHACSIPILSEILSASGLKEQAEYHAYTIVALMKIGDACPEFRKAISVILQNKKEEPNWKIRLRFIKYNVETYDAAPRFCHLIEQKLQHWQ